jgi:hypothetical protein
MFTSTVRRAVLLGAMVAVAAAPSAVAGTPGPPSGGLRSTHLHGSRLTVKAACTPGMRVSVATAAGRSVARGRMTCAGRRATARLRVPSKLGSMDVRLSHAGAVVDHAVLTRGGTPDGAVRARTAAVFMNDVDAYCEGRNVIFGSPQLRILAKNAYFGRQYGSIVYWRAMSYNVNYNTGASDWWWSPWIRHIAGADRTEYRVDVVRSPFWVQPWAEVYQGVSAQATVRGYYGGPAYNAEWCLYR